MTLGITSPGVKTCEGFPPFWRNSIKQDKQTTLKYKITKTPKIQCWVEPPQLSLFSFPGFGVLAEKLTLESAMAKW